MGEAVRVLSLFKPHPSQNQFAMYNTPYYTESHKPKGAQTNMNINPPIQIDYGDGDGYKIATLEVHKYGNGSMAVQAMTDDGEPACTVSVNMVNDAHRLGEGEFFVKEWSENERPVSALIERGIVVLVADKKPAVSGYVQARVGKLDLTKLEG